jgi:glycosidase
MRWDASTSGGFSAGDPWLPVHPDSAHNVADQAADPTSMLALVRTLIALRKTHLSDPDARYREVEVGEQIWIFDSGPLRVVANFSDDKIDYAPAGVAVLSSRTVAPHPSTTLGPWEAVVTVRP